jgi:hypothetical protein
MLKSRVSAILVAAVLAVGSTVATQAWSQAAAPPSPKISQNFAKTFKAAQDAQKAKQWPEVISKAQEVLAASGRKPDDTYYANFLLYDAYHNTNNIPEMRKALLGLVDSGFLQPAQQTPFLKALMSIAFQSKDYDAAVDFGTRMIKSENADADVYTTVGQSYYLKGSYKESASFFNNLVSDQVKRGEKPREQNLQLLQSSYSKLNNKEAESDALEKLVVYYENPKYWDALLYSVRTIPALDPRQKLWVYRLMWATNTLKQGSDFSRFAEYATGAGLPAEAQKVFEAGLKANAFSEEDKASSQRRMASAAKTAASDQADIGKLEAQAKAASTGELDITLGMSQYSYGDFPKAIEALQRGLSKGGLKDQQAIDGAMFLGMAQLRTKDNGAAQKTFQGIKTSDTDMARVAKLWLLYAR